MSQVNLPVIKPSNIKLIFKSYGLFLCKVSFIADTCHFFFFLVTHFISLLITSQFPFRELLFPNVCNLSGK